MHIDTPGMVTFRGIFYERLKCIVIYDLGEQQCKNQEHDFADALAAAFDGEPGTQITAGDGAQGSRQQNGVHGFSVEQIDHTGGNVGGKVRDLGTAAGDQQLQSHNTGEADDQESAGAGTDQTVVAANDQANGAADPANGAADSNSFSRRYL